MRRLYAVCEGAARRLTSAAGDGGDDREFGAVVERSTDSISDGGVRDSGPVEERIDRIGFFQIWPDNATYMLDRWEDFTTA